MLSLPNLALRHGKVTGSNRLMYPLNNDPIVQNRLYWNEEFDEEFLQVTGKNNNKTNNNMNTSGLKGFTAGATPSQPYTNVDGQGGGGGTDYNQYGQTANATLGMVSSLACQLFKKCGATQTPPQSYTPPAPTPTPPADLPLTGSWSMGAKIAATVGALVVAGGLTWLIVRVANKGK